MRSRGKALTSSNLFGFSQGEALTEPDGSHFFLKLVSRTTTVKDIVGTGAIGTGTCRSRAISAAMTGEATLRATGMGPTVLLRMSKTPAALALARVGYIRADGLQGTTNVDTVGEVMAPKEDLSNIHRTSPAAPRRKGITLHTNRIVRFQQRQKISRTIGPLFVIDRAVHG